MVDDDDDGVWGGGVGWGMVHHMDICSPFLYQDTTSLGLCRSRVIMSHAHT